MFQSFGNPEPKASQAEVHLKRFGGCAPCSGAAFQELCCQRSSLWEIVVADVGEVAVVVVVVVVVVVLVLVLVLVLLVLVLVLALRATHIIRNHSK